jgi:hypothetical protein
LATYILKRVTGMRTVQAVPATIESTDTLLQAHQLTEKGLPVACDVRSEILTAMWLKIQVFLGVTQCQRLL